MHTDITDEQRIRALGIALRKAEAEAGLEGGEGYPLKERGYRILESAQHIAIVSRFYRLAWFLWKTASAMPQ